MQAHSTMKCAVLNPYYEMCCVESIYTMKCAVYMLYYVYIPCYCVDGGGLQYSCHVCTFFGLFNEFCVFVFI